ncbi:hypothetical protein QTP88_017096 [Uroleucon formosanum]
MHQSGSDTARRRGDDARIRRPRRINYNRGPEKSSLGELFIDPACPNRRRAREHCTLNDIENLWFSEYSAQHAARCDNHCLEREARAAAAVTDGRREGGTKRLKKKAFFEK